MHILSPRNRSEFLAVPQLVRFSMPKGSDGPEATILLKASSLCLKYLVRRSEFEIVVVRLSDDCIGYGLAIKDGDAYPALIWSIAESDEEIFALKELSQGKKCVFHAFNELAINVFWSEFSMSEGRGLIIDITSKASKCSKVSEASDEFHQKVEMAVMSGINSNDVCRIPIRLDFGLQKLLNSYITNRIGVSDISIFDLDEGRQQEEVALWLVDNLHPIGALRSPQVCEPSGRVRELSDLIITYEMGNFILESKTLNIFGRENLPTREKLSQDLSKHLDKACRQLSGGLKNIKMGCEIRDTEGRIFDVHRTEDGHVIVLVPDLELMSNLEAFGGKFQRDFLEKTKHCLHFLDVSELLRVVQAAEMISEAQSITKLMAFDYYLLKRSKISLEKDSPAMHMLYRG